MWAGVVSNDTLALLRSVASTARPRPRHTRARRPRLPARAGPPAAAGRWSLVAELAAPRPSPTARAAALAAQLLDRHGVLVRDAVAAEEIAGGFSAVYGVLTAMEESGRARRGYFVEGLGGVQFSVPGAVDRLRGLREPGMDATAAQPVLLAATDPANPYGAALAWPQPTGDARHIPKRVAGGYVVVADGALLVYVERGGRSLLTFTAEPDALEAAAFTLRDVPHRGGALRIGRIDGEVVGDQPVVAALRGAGFADHPRGLVLRAPAIAGAGGGGGVAGVGNPWRSARPG